MKLEPRENLDFKLGCNAPEKPNTQGTSNTDYRFYSLKLPMKVLVRFIKHVFQIVVCSHLIISPELKNV
jgi:hypothetical protein